AVPGSREWEPGAHRPVDTLDREHLVARRPHQTAHDLPGAEVDRVHAGLAAIWIETGGVVAILRDHPARGDEGEVAVEEKPASPARKLHDGFEAPVDDAAQFAVAAVVDPHVLAAKPCGVRPREPGADHLASSAREHDSAAIDGEVQMARPPPAR